MKNDTKLIPPPFFSSVSINFLLKKKYIYIYVYIERYSHIFDLFQTQLQNQTITALSVFICKGPLVTPLQYLQNPPGDRSPNLKKIPQFQYFP